MCRLAGRHFFHSIAGPCPVNTRSQRPGYGLKFAARADFKGKPVGSWDLGVANACRGVTRYCSVFVSQYDISYGGSISSSSLKRTRQAPWHGRPTTGMDSAQGLEWLRRKPDGLDRRKGRTPEEIVGGRPVRQPDRGRTRRHHPQCGDRQGAPPRPVGAGQEPLLVAARGRARRVPPACCGCRGPRCAAIPRSPTTTTWSPSRN